MFIRVQVEIFVVYLIRVYIGIILDKNKVDMGKTFFFWSLVYKSTEVLQNNETDNYIFNIL